MASVTMSIIDSLKCPCGKGEAFRQVCPGCATMGCVHCVIINGLCVHCRVVLATFGNPSVLKPEPNVIDISNSEVDVNHSDYEEETATDSDTATVSETNENEVELEVDNNKSNYTVYPKPLREQVLEVITESNREWMNVKEITDLRPAKWWSTKEEVKHLGVTKGVYVLYKLKGVLTRKKINGVFYYKLIEEHNPKEVNRLIRGVLKHLPSRKSVDYCELVKVKPWKVIESEVESDTMSSSASESESKHSESKAEDNKINQDKCIHRWEQQFRGDPDIDMYCLKCDFGLGYTEFVYFFNKYPERSCNVPYVP